MAYDSLDVIKKIEVKSYARGHWKVWIIEMSMQNARKVSLEKAWEIIGKKLKEQFEKSYKEV